MDGLRQDLRQAARALRRRPGLTLVAVLTLGLGLGAATAIFSVADAVILRPLPFADPGRLFMVWQADTAKNERFVEMAYPTFRDWREQNHVFEDMAGMPSTNQGWILSGRGEPLPVLGRWVTGRFFDVLGVRPALGRTFQPEDDGAAAPRVVILADAFWRSHLGADSAIVGQTLVLDDEPYTVVGVMPGEFAYPKGAQIWVPLVRAAGPIADMRNVWWMSAVGRLKAGVSPDQARREMAAFALRYNREQFKEESLTAVLTPVRDTIFGPTRPALLALLGAVGLVLLIACANVAGLLLVRAMERSRDLAVRLALGAGAFRLARGLLAESALLAAAGGALGVVVAVAGTPALVTLSPSDLPRLSEAAVDVRALAFALAACTLTALVSGLAPMLTVRSLSLERELRAGARSVALGRARMGAALAVAEVALSLVLLVGAGLLARSFVHLREVPLGFDPDRLLSVSVGPRENRYPQPRQWRAFYEELLSRVRALPDVESAAVVMLRPLWGTVGMDWRYTIEGQSEQEASRNTSVNMETVSADYFRTMRIPVLRGRAFTDGDVDGQPGVVVIGDALARRAWPGQDPIGKRLKIPLPDTPYDKEWLTVVGVVADARYRELPQGRLDLYMSYRQANHHVQHLMVRTRSQEWAALAPAIRAAVRAIDAGQPVSDVITMRQVVDDALGGPRFAARLFSAFAVVAVLLAALGLYGLLAYSVTRRTREIGVRVALGARPVDVSRLVLGEGMALAVLGIAIGLAAAAAAARLLRSLLYGVEPLDAVTFAAVPLLLAAVAAGACLLPARRARRVDPVEALRAE
jgi:putative ABC transport system permease protein